MDVVKHSKQEARYTDDHGTSSEQCSKCTHFRRVACTIVEGMIKPGGWCKFFRRKLSWRAAA